MQQVVFSITFISILFLSCNEGGKTPTKPTIIEEKENYGTGELSRTYTRVNGSIEGKMTDYYPSGTIKGERYFHSGQQDGKTTLFYESRAVKEVQYYNKGKRTGGDTLFYESGKLQYVSEFKDDKKNGYLRKWDEGGKLIYEARFAMDTLVEVMGQQIKTGIK